VHAEHARAALERDHARGDGAVHALGHVPAREPPDERLARGADHERAPEVRELVEAGEQHEVVLHRLAEADPGVELDLGFRHARRDRRLHAFGE